MRATLVLVLAAAALAPAIPAAPDAPDCSTVTQLEPLAPVGLYAYRNPSDGRLEAWRESNGLAGLQRVPCEGAGGAAVRADTLLAELRLDERPCLPYDPYCY